jgi:hypothetical protein
MFGFACYMRYTMALWSNFLARHRGETPQVNMASATDESLRLGNEPIIDKVDKFMDELKDVLMEPIPNV